MEKDAPKRLKQKSSSQVAAIAKPIKETQGNHGSDDDLQSQTQKFAVSQSKASGARPTSHRLPTWEGLAAHGRDQLIPTSSAAEQRKIHKVKVEKAQENLKNSKEENNNKRKVSRKIKPGMEVGLRSPNNEDLVALGTVEEAAGDHIQVMINLVLNSTTRLPQAQGRMTILAHAQAHSVPWPKRNVTTEEIDKNWAEIVSSMDKGLRVHFRSDNKTPLTLEEIADIRAERIRKKKRRSLQEISEQISSQVE